MPDGAPSPQSGAAGAASAGAGPLSSDQSWLATGSPTGATAEPRAARARSRWQLPCTPLLSAPTPQDAPTGTAACSHAAAAEGGHALSCSCAICFPDRAEPADARATFRCEQCYEEQKRMTSAEMIVESWCNRCFNDTLWRREPQGHQDQRHGTPPGPTESCLSGSNPPRASEASQPSGQVYRCQGCHSETRALQLQTLHTESYCRTCEDDTTWIREEFQDVASTAFSSAGEVHHDSNVRLIIGGRLFYASAATILAAEPDCIFAPMLSGSFNLTDGDDSGKGAIRIDRPSKWFQNILDYCRQGCLILGHHDDGDLDEIEAEARFYCMQGLLRHVETRRHMLRAERKQRHKEKRRQTRHRVRQLKSALGELEDLLCIQNDINSRIENFRDQPRRDGRASDDEEDRLCSELLERNVHLCQVLHGSLGDALRCLQRTSLTVAHPPGFTPVSVSNDAEPMSFTPLQPSPQSSLCTSHQIPTFVPPQQLATAAVRRQALPPPSAATGSPMQQPTGTARFTLPAPPRSALHPRGQGAAPLTLNVPALSGADAPCAADAASAAGSTKERHTEHRQIARSLVPSGAASSAHQYVPASEAPSSSTIAVPSVPAGAAPLGDCAGRVDGAANLAFGKLQLEHACLQRECDTQRQRLATLERELAEAAEHSREMDGKYREAQGQVAVLLQQLREQRATVRGAGVCFAVAAVALAVWARGTT
eukprot:TRINITY_DN6261_c0_g1_i2.p1 TRINITY_DN6261_c0_g1~~TRINITY_DN6261_c0_g1_i2.p1  ORF type:complete len:710 (+),score=148.34 TRINITY_DN6261_c0_g1_i2:271-2400(+)